MMRVADCGLIITTMSKEETLVVGSSSSCKEGRTRSVTTGEKKHVCPYSIISAENNDTTMMTKQTKTKHKREITTTIQTTRINIITPGDT
jgi:hypothetical protein